MKSRVSVQICRQYDPNMIATAMLTLIESLEDNIGLLQGSKDIFIKPNIAGPFPPEQGATTHPLFLKALIKVIRELGSRPVVGEGPGSLLPAFELSGIQAVCEQEDVKLLLLTEEDYTQITCGDFKQIEQVAYSKALLDAELVITLPKLKTHALVYYTGAIKNMFGCVQPRDRKILHLLENTDHFCEALVDIFTIRKPELAIIDGIVAMEGVGPTHGRLKSSGLMMASTDSVALDAVASHAMGYDPFDVATTRIADKRGIGNGRLDMIEVFGADIIQFAGDFKKIPLLEGKSKNRFLRLALGKLVVDVQKCEQCGVCVKSCPAGALTMTPYPEMDSSKCIFCYCCLELCSLGVISVDPASRLGALQ